MSEVIEKDCNTCVRHRPGTVIMPALCSVCINAAPAGRALPEWTPCPDLLKVVNTKPPAVPATKAATYDDGKAPLSTLPWAALDEMSAVQAYGHKKYGDFYNYRKGMEVSRNLSCALRHIRDYMNGVDKDHESGCSHLGHAMTRLAFVLQNIHDGTAIDDRYKAPPKA